MNKNPRKYEWYTDPQGCVTAGWGLCMSARDMAVIGDSGNIIYINKEDNVSVGMTGTFKPRIFDRVEFIEQKVLPAIDGTKE